MDSWWESQGSFGDHQDRFKAPHLKFLVVVSVKRQANVQTLEEFNKCAMVSDEGECYAGYHSIRWNIVKNTHHKKAEGERIFNDPVMLGPSHELAKDGDGSV